MTDPNAFDKHVRYNLSVLSVGQSVMMMTIKTILITTGLIVLSFNLAPSLSTIPTVCMLIGLPIGTFIASTLYRLMSKVKIYIAGMLFSVAGCLLAGYAITSQLFLILCLGCFMIGVYSGFTWFYRYDAADMVKTDQKTKAISYIILAGVPAAIIGPWVAEKSEMMIHGYPFLATFIIFAILNCMLILLFIPMKLSIHHAKPTPSSGHAKLPKRSTKMLLTQRNFITSTLCTAVCYFIMSQVMVATPLAMIKLFHYPLSAMTFAMQLHFLGMFAPALVTAKLVNRFGIKTIILAGIAIYVMCTLIILSGTSLSHFYIGLLLLGIGWNFIFISGTTLNTKAYRPQERNLVQGANNVITSLFAALGALTSGPLLFHLGWTELNIIVLPSCAILLLTALWMHPSSSQS